MRWLVVGLGNPGLQYARDRHNAGFHVIDALSQELGLSCQPQRSGWFGKSKSYGGEANIGSVEVVLVQPQTFMNLSGEAVDPLVKRYDIAPENVLVVHDELELSLGRLKFKRGGGEAGHRGLLSISEWLGTRDYPRLRFGIGRPSSPDVSISDFVLCPPSSEQEDLWEASVAQAVKMVRCCCEEGLVQAMNQWNSRRLPVSEKTEGPSETQPPESH